MRRTKTSWRRLISFIILVNFAGNVILPPQAAAQFIPQNILPAPGTMINPTNRFTPLLMKGLTVHPENPLEFDFIINTGEKNVEGEEFNKEATRLIKYFLASLTVPEEELWVNLSPYEKDRIVPNGLGQTEMGRDLLAQDYILKQLTASLVYPENDLGKDFWARIYKEAQAKFGTTDIPVDSFNKVWVVPDKAVVYEHDNSAYVAGSHLKVMMEQDYVALQSNAESLSEARGISSSKEQLATQIIKEIIIPSIEKEVNEGHHFTTLRQIYNSLILAVWYKKNLRESLLGQVYVDQNKTKGVDLEDKETKQKIYNQYLEAFKQGVYNYVKEEYDPATQEVASKKYFAGGMNVGIATEKVLRTVQKLDAAALPVTGNRSVKTILAENPKTTDAATLLGLPLRNKFGQVLSAGVITSIAVVGMIPCLGSCGIQNEVPIVPIVLSEQNQKRVEKTLSIWQEVREAKTGLSANGFTEAQAILTFSAAQSGSDVTKILNTLKEIREKDGLNTLGGFGFVSAESILALASVQPGSDVNKVLGALKEIREKDGLNTFGDAGFVLAESILALASVQPGSDVNKVLSALKEIREKDGLNTFGGFGFVLEESILALASVQPGSDVGKVLDAWKKIRENDGLNFWGGYGFSLEESILVLASVQPGSDVAKVLSAFREIRKKDGLNTLGGVGFGVEEAILTLRSVQPKSDVSTALGIWQEVRKAKTGLYSNVFTKAQAILVLATPTDAASLAKKIPKEFTVELDVTNPSQLHARPSGAIIDVLKLKGTLNEDFNIKIQINDRPWVSLEGQGFLDLYNETIKAGAERTKEEFSNKSPKAVKLRIRFKVLSEKFKEKMLDTAIALKILVEDKKFFERDWKDFDWQKDGLRNLIQSEVDKMDDAQKEALLKRFKVRSADAASLADLAKIRRDFFKSGDIENGKVAFVMIKPDGIKDREAILNRFRENGFEVFAGEPVRITEAQARALYKVHEGKPYYPLMVAQISSGEVLPFFVRRQEGNAVAMARVVQTNIRNTYGVTSKDLKNVLHASDSKEAVLTESAAVVADAAQMADTVIDFFLSEQKVEVTAETDLEKDLGWDAAKREEVYRQLAESIGLRNELDSEVTRVGELIRDVESEIALAKAELTDSEIDASSLVHTFKLTAQDLQGVVNNFADEVGLRTKGEDSSLMMVPSFLQKYDGNLHGQFIGVDFSGTNLRVMLVELAPGQEPKILDIKQVEFSPELKKGSKENLFKFLAQQVSKLGLSPDQNYDLGFTFAYPFEQASLNSGILKYWTKGWAVKGVEGQDVVELFQNALNQNGLANVQIQAVLNDTVGTQLTLPGADIGLIFGTGMNFSAIDPKTGQIVNMEAGAFNKIPLTKEDFELAFQAEPFRQVRVEKLVSGKYLGEIVRLRLRNLHEQGKFLAGKTADAFYKEGTFPSELLSDIEEVKYVEEGMRSILIGQASLGLSFDDLEFNDIALVREVVQEVSERAGRLVGALIVAGVQSIDPLVENAHLVAVDGSVYEKHPKMKEYVRQALEDILGKEKAGRIEIKMTKDGSGIGAAIAAAVAVDQKAKGDPAVLSSVESEYQALEMVYDAILFNRLQSPATKATIRELPSSVKVLDVKPSDALSELSKLTLVGGVALNQAYKKGFGVQVKNLITKLRERFGLETDDEPGSGDVYVLGIKGKSPRYNTNDLARVLMEYLSEEMEQRLPLILDADLIGRDPYAAISKILKFLERKNNDLSAIARLKTALAAWTKTLKVTVDELTEKERILNDTYGKYKDGVILDRLGKAIRPQDPSVGLPNMKTHSARGQEWNKALVEALKVSLGTAEADVNIRSRLLIQLANINGILEALEDSINRDSAQLVAVRRQFIENEDIKNGKVAFGFIMPEGFNLQEGIFDDVAEAGFEIYMKGGVRLSEIQARELFKDLKGEAVFQILIDATVSGKIYPFFVRHEEGDAIAKLNRIISALFLSRGLSTETPNRFIHLSNSKERVLSDSDVILSDAAALPVQWTREKIIEKLKDVLNREFGIQKAMLEGDPLISSFEWDGLELVEFMVSLEGVFGIEISDEDVRNLFKITGMDNYDKEIKLSAVVDYLEKRLKRVQDNAMLAVEGVEDLQHLIFELRNIFNVDNGQDLSIRSLHAFLARLEEIANANGIKLEEGRQEKLVTSGGFEDGFVEERRLIRSNGPTMIKAREQGATLPQVTGDELAQAIIEKLNEEFNESLAAIQASQRNGTIAEGRDADLEKNRKDLATHLINLAEVGRLLQVFIELRAILIVDGKVDPAKIKLGTKLRDMGISEDGLTNVEVQVLERFKTTAAEGELDDAVDEDSWMDFTIMDLVKYIRNNFGDDRSDFAQLGAENISAMDAAELRDLLGRLNRFADHAAENGGTADIKVFERIKEIKDRLAELSAPVDAAMLESTISQMIDAFPYGWLIQEPELAEALGNAVDRAKFLQDLGRATKLDQDSILSALVDSEIGRTRNGGSFGLEYTFRARFYFDTPWTSFIDRVNRMIKNGGEKLTIDQMLKIFLGNVDLNAFVQGIVASVPKGNISARQVIDVLAEKGILPLLNAERDGEEGLKRVDAATLTTVEVSEDGNFKPNGLPIVMIVEDSLSLSASYAVLLKTVAKDQKQQVQFVMTRNYTAARKAADIALGTGLLKLIITDGMYPTTGDKFELDRPAGVAMTEFAHENGIKVVVISAEADPNELFKNSQGQGIAVRPDKYIVKPGGSDFILEELWPEYLAGTDAAELDKNVGGINLNPAFMDMQIKRDGRGVPLPLPQQPIQNMKIEGFLPIIINVTPINNLPLLLGVAQQADQPMEVSLR